MIPDEAAEKAVDFLRDTARAAAQARAERLYMEQWIKTVLAQEQAKSAGGSVAASEIQARDSDAYKAALEAYRDAIQADEEFRFRREAASAKLEAWRSQSANERAARP